MYTALFAIMLFLQQTPPSLEQLLQRAQTYVAGYESKLGNLIGSESYLQTWKKRSGRTATRRTNADLLLVQVGHEWAALRKVQSLDGFKVRKAEEGFQQAFADTPADNSKRLTQLKQESSEYNLGDILREINSPTFALKILRASEIDRFNFELGSNARIDGRQVVAVKFLERGLNTLTRGTRGELLHSTGTLWIEPASGRVIKTEFLVENPYALPPVRARTTVIYGSVKDLDILVPRNMIEHYESSESSIDCLANYSNFHRFEVNVKFDFGGKPEP